MNDLQSCHLIGVLYNSTLTLCAKVCVSVVHSVPRSSSAYISALYLKSQDLLGSSTVCGEAGKKVDQTRAKSDHCRDLDRMRRDYWNQYWGRRWGKRGGKVKWGNRVEREEKKGRGLLARLEEQELCRNKTRHSLVLILCFFTTNTPKQPLI